LYHHEAGLILLLQALLDACAEVLLGSKGYVEKSLLSALGASQLCGSKEGESWTFWGAFQSPKKLGFTSKNEAIIIVRLSWEFHWELLLIASSGWRTSCRRVSMEMQDMYQRLAALDYHDFGLHDLLRDRSSVLEGFFWAQVLTTFHRMAWKLQCRWSGVLAITAAYLDIPALCHNIVPAFRNVITAGNSQHCSGYGAEWKCKLHPLPFDVVRSSIVTDIIGQPDLADADSNLSEKKRQSEPAEGTFPTTGEVVCSVAKAPPTGTVGVVIFLFHLLQRGSHLSTIAERVISYNLCTISWGWNRNFWILLNWGDRYEESILMGILGEIDMQIWIYNKQKIGYTAHKESKNWEVWALMIHFYWDII